MTGEVSDVQPISGGILPFDGVASYRPNATGARGPLGTQGLSRASVWLRPPSAHRANRRPQYSHSRWTKKTAPSRRHHHSDLTAGRQRGLYFAQFDRGATCHRASRAFMMMTACGTRERCAAACRG